ncbi:MAG: hypothetical protein P4L99_09615 [Chthoniobacter sp.]|nr:hypothetical protein [Chthoniobacter sp.]
MKLKSPFREPVRVVRHGEGSVTYVSLTRYESSGIAGGDVIWDIPTESIPFHFRGIGSEFLVIRPNFTPEDNDPADEIRRLAGAVEVRELESGETFTK